MAHSDWLELTVRLRSLLEPYAPGLVVVCDEPHDYHLDTSYIMKNKHPIFFGAARAKERYAAYHLMPVYVFPELLEGLSPALKARMHGKSCFSIRRADPELFAELGALTRAGYERFAQAGYVEALRERAAQVRG